MASKLTNVDKQNYLNELAKIANNHGGKLLSTQWINNVSLYEFEYHDGTIFNAYAYVIKKNGWPSSLKRYLKTDNEYLNDLREIAEKNEGQLLSSIWIGSKKKYQFRDKFGTFFEKSYSHMKASGWPQIIRNSNENENLDFISKKALEKGFLLIDKEWFGWNYKYTFRKCSNLLECKIVAHYIKEKGFPKNPHEIKRKLFLQKLQKIALKNDFELLDLIWKGAKKYYKFVSKNDSSLFIEEIAQKIFDTEKIIQPKIIKKVEKNPPIPKNYLQIMKNIAIENEGELLSIEWMGSRKKYVFKTKTGKIFYRTYKSLITSGWLKERKKSINLLGTLEKIAIKNNGELLSSVWINKKTKYIFKTSSGEIFEASAFKIIKNGWPKNLIKYRNKDYYLNEMKKLALSKGGKLLSKDYVNRDTKYLFEDAYGTKFRMSFTVLKNNCWNENHGFISEPIVRQAMNHLFKTVFLKNRSVLHKEITYPYRCLELDGYSEKLKLAFEYQGHPSHWDKKYKTYNEVLKRDKKKKKLCKKLGILLIIIPPINRNNIWDANKVIKHIQEQIIKMKELSLHSINNTDFKIDFLKIKQAKENFDRLQEIVQSNNAQVIDKEWQGLNFKYTFITNNNLSFKRTARKMFELGWPKDVEKYLKRYNKAI